MEGRLPVIGDANPLFGPVGAAIAGTGEAVIVWTEYTDGYHRIYMSEYY